MKVESVRVSYKPNERIAAIKRFNDAGEDIDAFVTSLSVASYSFNLYNCYTDGIVL